MGYELHITRKENWSDDDGPTISADEWRKLIRSDPDLQLDEITPAVIGDTDTVSAGFRAEAGVFIWDSGEIWTKNPEPEVVKKAVQIALSLEAKAQGDDGEIYGPDGQAVPEEQAAQSAPLRPGLLSRIIQWFRHRHDVKGLQQAAPAFKVGDRVRDVFGSIGTITEIDAKAQHGLGQVRVQFDDGRERTLALVASGLEIMQESGGAN